jgi:5-methyltetrahydrofolate--homocysteine methyltransferase
MSGLLNSRGTIPTLADGAMGTELQRMGLAVTECGDCWNIDHPEKVKAVHQSYVDADARLITTNSFRANRYALRYFGLESKVREFNLAAARIAREVTGSAALVIGSVGPFGGFMKPFGDTPGTDVYGWSFEQASLLLEGGVDAILVETMTTVEEMQLATRSARDAGATAIIATMSFNKVNDDYLTMKGVTVEQGVEAMLGADVIGCNCGADLFPDDYVVIAERIRKYSGKPMMIKMNAGKPELIGGQVVYKQTPEMMAAVVRNLVKAGVDFIGGCCGTTPAHISSIGRALSDL